MISFPRPRRLWGDVRFLIGIALIVAAVTGVWLVVSSARQTMPVLQATRTIVPGETIGGAVRVVEVALGTAADGYLAPDALPDGMVATRTIEDGELVPRTAAAPAESSRVTSIVVESTTAIPGSVAAGAAVELWSSAPSGEAKGFAAPRILLDEATVASVTRADGLLAGGHSSVELVVDRAEVGTVLGAVAEGAALSVVPLRARP
ncbi:MULTISPECIES: hypothetical protein [Bacteria]|uniref:hypothetical protein n=1 Tax=Bacteria TaxID=2 RepID=UPI003C7D4514